MWRANPNKTQIIGLYQFYIWSIEIAWACGYDNYKTNTGHGGRDLGISFVANFGCSISTLKTFACHTRLEQTARYAKGNGEDRMEAAVAVRVFRQKRRNVRAVVIVIVFVI